MPLLVEQFCRLRPYLYHVTSRENLAGLRRHRAIDSAAAIMRRCGRSDLLRCRRNEALALMSAGDTIVLKDQHPLIEMNIDLRGCTFDEFIEYMNEHVFFWPGGAERPIRAGINLHGHYQADNPAVLRIRTSDLLAANPRSVPLFCEYNSGAPRQQRGRRVPRGRRLFRPANEFPRNAGDVIELVFRDSVVLPESTDVADANGWAQLYSC